MVEIDKRYQQLLKDLQLYSGEVDGILGPNTKEALRKFEIMVGMNPADGFMTNALKTKLELFLAPNPDRTNYTEMVMKDEESHYHRWPHESYEELIKFYGQVGENQVKLELPYKMKLAWEPTTIINSFQCHEKVADSLYNVLHTVQRIYSSAEIEQHGFNMFGGCFNVRNMRGSTKASTHSWGIAIDIDPARNGLRQKWSASYLSKPECMDFVDTFRDEGWYSLGREKDYDSMHFQACWR